MILSQKHGVNPTLPVCFFCLRETGEVALLGRLPGDAEAPRHAVLDHQPCNECKKWMEKGIILISVSNSTQSGDNPERTGGWCVVKDEALRDIIQTPEVLIDILKKRFAFVPDEVWDAMGLPREPEGEEHGTA